MKLVEKTFTVEGQGNFPFDMLRYDRCWPKTAEDAAKLEWNTMTTVRNSRRRVTLATYRPLHEPASTPKRWDSFTWRVIDSE